MFSLMLHRIILVFTLITGTVNSGPNTYWSKRSEELRPGGYRGQEISTKIEAKSFTSKNTRFAIEKRMFTFSIFNSCSNQSVEINELNEITVKNPNLKRYRITSSYPFLHL